MPRNRQPGPSPLPHPGRAADSIRRRIGIGSVVLAASAALPRGALAQRAPRKARIGWLGWNGGPGAMADAAPLESLRTALRGAGWIERRNLVIESRAGEGAQSRELTAELLRLDVSLIVAQGPMVFGARAVAGALPLVFTINGDPVEAGLVSSFARPGANLTGITALVPELSGKRLELLKECMPAITRVAALGNAAHPGVQMELRETEFAARRLGLALRYVPLRSAADFAPAFAALAADGTQALVAFPDTLIESQERAIAAFSVERHVPAISGWAEFAAAGNLMSYGPNRQAFYRRAGVYADRILRGARPAELPVEQPTRFDLTINLKAAEALGLRVPPSMLLRADTVTPA